MNIPWNVSLSITAPHPYFVFYESTLRPFCLSLQCISSSTLILTILPSQEKTNPNSCHLISGPILLRSSPLSLSIKSTLNYYNPSFAYTLHFCASLTLLNSLGKSSILIKSNSPIFGSAPMHLSVAGGKKLKPCSLDSVENKSHDSQVGLLCCLVFYVSLVHLLLWSP